MGNTAITDLLNEESYKDLFDNAHDLIHIVDLEGKIIYANKSWTNLLEYSLEEVQGTSLYSFVDEDDRLPFIEYRNQIINGGINNKEINIRLRTKSGKKVSLEGFVSLRKKNNFPFYTRGIFRDITSKLENEAQLKEREFNLQQLLLNAPDAIVVINKKSIISFWNPQAEKMFGWTVEEAMNQPLSEKIIPRQYREAHDIGMKRYLTTGVAHVLNKTINITAINKTGEEFYVSLTISTTRQNGELSFIAFLRDIREQKKNEAELEKKRNELEISNQHLEQFAHVASHDMKEPIRKIRMFSDMLENELGNQMNQHTRNYLGKIISAAERLQSMVEGVLNYATVSNIDVAFEQIDLNAIIDNIKNDLEVIIQQKNAVINYDNLPTLPGVRFLVYQLFYNLIYNSLKFSKEDVPPLIEITSKKLIDLELKNTLITDQKTSFIEIEVKDNGIGFNQDYATKIFKTFTRLNNRSQYEGTGLGLSLCKNIMERHNGFILAEGKEDLGATFTLLFPAAKESA